MRVVHGLGRLYSSSLFLEDGFAWVREELAPLRKTCVAGKLEGEDQLESAKVKSEGQTESEGHLESHRSMRTCVRIYVHTRKHETQTHDLTHGYGQVSHVDPHANAQHRRAYSETSESLRTAIHLRI